MRIYGGAYCVRRLVGCGYGVLESFVMGRLSGLPDSPFALPDVLGHTGQCGMLSRYK